MHSLESQLFSDGLSVEFLLNGFFERGEEVQHCTHCCVVIAKEMLVKPAHAHKPHDRPHPHDRPCPMIHNSKT